MLSHILIPATKSLTLTSKLPHGNINNDNIIVGTCGGNMYISYLFFDISSIPIDASIYNAELVLFKTNNFYNDSKKVFCICQINDYFSTYSTFKNFPIINTSSKTFFYPVTSKVAVTVNLTDVVTLWKKNKISITGLALFNISNNIVSKFGSAICKNSYITPYINISIKPITHPKCYCYNNTNCNIEIPSTEQIEVIGTVAPKSIYDAIVNIEVKRSNSGHTDNYYVCDKYDNSSNSDPLFINKTYNMAIMPCKTPSDVETVTFYGSYKA